MKTIEVRVSENAGIGFRDWHAIAIDRIMEKTGTRSTWDRPADITEACDRAMKKLGARQVNNWYDHQSRDYVWQFVIEEEKKSSWWRFWK